MVARTSGITVLPATPPMIGANTTVLCVCVCVCEGEGERKRKEGGGGKGGGEGEGRERGVGRGEREMKVQYLSNTNKSGSSMVYDSLIPRLSCAWK